LRYIKAIPGPKARARGEHVQARGIRRKTPINGPGP